MCSCFSPVFSHMSCGFYCRILHRTVVFKKCISCGIAELTVSIIPHLKRLAPCLQLVFPSSAHTTLPLAQGSSAVFLPSQALSRLLLSAWKVILDLSSVVPLLSSVFNFSVTLLGWPLSTTLPTSISFQCLYHVVYSFSSIYHSVKL